MRKCLVSVLVVLLYLGNARAQTAGDYLILQDIGLYKTTVGREFQIRGRVFHSGPIVSQHGDEVSGNITRYETTYAGGEGYAAPTVQITLHSSSQWLGHEVERGFRDGLGMPDDSFAIRQIDGNYVLVFGSAGWAYQWISGANTVVSIEYHDSQMTKPEPLEIVRAYLAKYPSSLPAISSADLRTGGNKTKWVTDEMERRVWLMEKWVGVGSADVLKQAEAERAILSHADAFAKYMKKYLGDSPNEMIKGFFLASRPSNWARLTAEVVKLRTWWDANKSRPLTISGISSGFRLAEGWPILLGGLGAARQLWVERGRVSGYLGRWLSRER